MGRAVRWSALERTSQVENIRAYAMWSLVDVLRMKFGAGGLNEVRMRLSRERRAQFRALPGQSAWFDYGLYLDVIRGAVARFYGDDVRGAYELSRAAKQLDARRMFAGTGIFDSPRALLSQLGALRSHYLDGGQFESGLVEVGHIRFAYGGLGPDSPVAAYDAAGGIAGMLETSGARRVRLVELDVWEGGCSGLLSFDEARPQRALRA